MIVKVQYAIFRSEQTGRVDTMVETHSSIDNPAAIIVERIFEQMANGTNLFPFEKNKRGNPESMQEILSILKENKKVFVQEGRACNARSFILKYFWDLQNCIEDGRIEQLLLRN